MEEEHEEKRRQREEEKKRNVGSWKGKKKRSVGNLKKKDRWLEYEENKAHERELRRLELEADIMGKKEAAKREHEL